MDISPCINFCKSINTRNLKENNKLGEKIYNSQKIPETRPQIKQTEEKSLTDTVMLILLI